MRKTLAAVALSLALLGCKDSGQKPAPTATTEPAKPTMPAFAPAPTPAGKAPEPAPAAPAPAPEAAKPPEPAAAAAEPPPAGTAAAEPPAAPPPAGEAAKAPDSWVTWVHPEKLISVKFPGTPQQSENEAPSAIGPVKFTMAMQTSESRAFMAGATAYKIDKDTPFDVAKALDAGRDQMLANMKAKSTSEKQIKLDGFDGREVEFEVDGPNGQKIHGIARVFAGNDPPAGYFAGAFRMTDAVDPDFATFLDSVHLGKAVTP